MFVKQCNIEQRNELRYRSIITSLLHASPRVSPRVVRVEGAKIYRGKVRFHVTGRGFSTRRLVAFHDTWRFHERSRGISTRPVTVESRVVLLLLLLLSNLPVRHWKAYTKGQSLYKVLTYSQGT